MSNQSSGLRKEIIIPLVVSILGGIIVASYQFFLEGYKSDKTPTITQQPVVVPANNVNSPTTDPTAVAIQQYITVLNERIVQANDLLRKKQCDEAQSVIAGVVWEHTEIDDNRSLALKYEKIKGNLETELALCRADDVLKAAEAELEPEARRSALASLKRYSTDIDMLSQNLELAEKKDRFGEDVYKITYVYKIDAISREEKGRKVSVQCHIPLIDGKPSKGVIDKTDIENQ